MRVAVYCRVSTDEQRERQTIENQVDLAQRYCTSKELNIIDFYRDDGITGTIPLGERPEGKRLLADAEISKFDMVVVKQIDRLGRDALYILNAAYQLEALGIQVRSILEAVDLSTPQGKFMLTIHSGVAALERDTIVQRSIEGTNRLAQQGVWLGGIVPYGYLVNGKDREARLVVSERLVPGLDMTEADVVRLIYRMSADEKRSCVAIADHLNALKVPPAYVRDGRDITVGKRTQTTAGIWRPSRVRNLIANTTYQGIHYYGRRSKKKREVIERAVPAIVSQEVWECAQRVLHNNMIYSKRNAKRKYLLRGLMKCGLCGLTFVGEYSEYKGRSRVYYSCNGRHGWRGLYGQQGSKCPAKSISAQIEEVIWDDIESFLRAPGEVLEQLESRMAHDQDSSESLRTDKRRLEANVRSKQAERDKVISLFRRDKIDEGALDRQLDEITREETSLQDQLARLTAALGSIDEARGRLRSAEQLLVELNTRLDGPLTWELKRELVEALVESIRVDTVDQDGKKRAEVTVTYRFSRAANRTDTDS